MIRAKLSWLRGFPNCTCSGYGEVVERESRNSSYKYLTREQNNHAPQSAEIAGVGDMEMLSKKHPFLYIEGNLIFAFKQLIHMCLAKIYSTHTLMEISQEVPNKANCLGQRGRNIFNCWQWRFCYFYPFVRVPRPEC